MRRIGNALIGIGLIGIFLTASVEPIDSIAFFIHAGVLTTMMVTMVVGIVMSRMK